VHTTRILTGLCLAILAIISVFTFPPIWFAALCAIVVTLAGIEWTHLLRLKNVAERVLFLTALWLSMWLCWQHLIIAQYVACLFWIGAFLLLLQPVDSLHWLSRKRVLLPMGLLILSTTWAAAAALQAYGHLIVFYMIMLVCFGDTGAYFVGVKLGKHKIAPALSPKKSYEGLVGGIIIGTIAGMSIVFSMPNMAWHQYLLWLVLGVFLLLVAALGDLFESLLKRKVNLKDSGSLLPGHGGFLDRVDSLCAALPVYFIVAKLLGLIP